MTTSLPHAVDPKALTEVLDGRWGHVRRDARENLHDPDLLPVYGENVQEAGRDPSAALPWGHGLVGLVRSAADWWLQADRPMPRVELAAHLTDLTWAGLSGVVTRKEDSNA